MEKKRLEIKPGVWYPGRAMLNDYGEWVFNPEQTGARAGVVKQIKKTDMYTLSYSANKIIVHLSLPRIKGMPLFKTFMDTVNNILTDLRTYEI